MQELIYTSKIYCINYNAYKEVYSSNIIPILYFKMYNCIFFYKTKWSKEKLHTTFSYEHIFFRLCNFVSFHLRSNKRLKYTKTENLTFKPTTYSVHHKHSIQTTTSSSPISNCKLKQNLQTSKIFCTLAQNEPIIFSYNQGCKKSG